MAEDDLDGFDPLAAEYALGVLDAPARAAAQARAAAEPAFAADVAAWERRLAPLLERAPEVAPSAAVWRRIAMQLGAAPAARRPRLTQSLGFWRAVSAASLAAAAASLTALVMRPEPTPTPVAPPTTAATQAVAMAALGGESGPPMFVAALDTEGHHLMVMPAVVAASPVHSHELWLLPASGPPRSLGIVSAERPMMLDVPADLPVDAVLAVSAEPVGGSPTGLPTGPVIAKGQLAS